MGRKSRTTKQKTLINSEMKKIHESFTAEELYKNVSSKDKVIGIATVYRFLKEMKEKGQIYSYVCDRRTVYSTFRKDHCHFICQKCGKSAHFNIQSLDFLQKKVSGEISQFQISVEGVCKDCVKS